MTAEDVRYVRGLLETLRPAQVRLVQIGITSLAGYDDLMGSLGRVVSDLESLVEEIERR